MCFPQIPLDQNVLNVYLICAACDEVMEPTSDFEVVSATSGDDTKDGLKDADSPAWRSEDGDQSPSIVLGVDTSDVDIQEVIITDTDNVAMFEVTVNDEDNNPVSSMIL